MRIEPAASINDPPPSRSPATPPIGPSSGAADRADGVVDEVEHPATTAETVGTEGIADNPADRSADRAADDGADHAGQRGSGLDDVADDGDLRDGLGNSVDHVRRHLGDRVSCVADEVDYIIEPSHGSSS